MNGTVSPELSIKLKRVLTVLLHPNISDLKEKLHFLRHKTDSWKHLYFSLFSEDTLTFTVYLLSLISAYY